MDRMIQKHHKRMYKYQPAVKKKSGTRKKKKKTGYNL